MRSWIEKMINVLFQTFNTALHAEWYKLDKSSTFRISSMTTKQNLKKYEFAKKMKDCFLLRIIKVWKFEISRMKDKKGIVSITTNGGKKGSRLLISIGSKRGKENNIFFIFSFGQILSFSCPSIQLCCICFKHDQQR